MALSSKIWRLDRSMPMRSQGQGLSWVSSRHWLELGLDRCERSGCHPKYGSVPTQYLADR